MNSNPIETVRTDTFTMDYFRFGTGADTLVIIPGLSVQSVMASADAIAEAYRILADEYTIYLFDRRNELPSAYSVYDMARDTAEAMRALGLENVCLFGASEGGMIAMDIAIEYPALVRKLVLGSAAARVAEEVGPIKECVRLAEAGDTEGVFLAFGKAVYPEDVFEQSRELLIEAAKTVTDEELARFLILLDGANGFDVTDDLGKIACPVLVIGSRDDQLLGPTAAEDLAARLTGSPDVGLYVYDGHGHAAYDTAPDYKERILRFLS